MKKPSILTIGFITATTIILASTVIITFMLRISIGPSGTSNSTQLTPQTVPTVINGITTSIGIAVALGIAVVGVIFRGEFKTDPKAKTEAMYCLALLFGAILYPWGSYLFLVIGEIDWAIRYSFAGYLFAVYAIIFALFSALRRLAKEKQPASDTSTREEKEPDKSKTEEKKKCYGCASAVDWLSWFRETISNRRDLTIKEKQDLIKGVVPTAGLNLTRCVCMEYGIWMENFGKTHDACKYFLPSSAGLDYHQMRQVEDRRLRTEQMKIQNKTNYAMVFLTIALVITTIVQILWR